MPPVVPRSPAGRAHRRRVLVIPLIVIALLSAACASPASNAAGTAVPTAPPTGASSSGTAPTGASPSGTAGPPAAQAGFPVTIDNCGTQVTVDAPPQRILAIKSTSLELLLALGVGDRVVGQAFVDSPVPAQWTAAAGKIPVISDQAPAQEPVLELEPDLIVAGWESNLAADTAGKRDTLAAKGIASYVSPAACKEKQYQPAKLTYQLLFDEFAELGRLLGVSDKAAALIAQQQQLLTTVQKAKAGTTALWWSSGTDTPYVGAGIGAPQMVMDAAGLTNIAADVKDTWTSLGWEPIIAANPDVIVLVDASWNPATKKIADLQNNPATARLDAVVHHRYIVVPFAAAEAGVRSVQAAVDVGAKARQLGFGD
ncbi:putative F420-0 ABC transporter substrate-binding protein [Nakamurella lactea]|uniref:putative F420-0 ABC transporter substrate-binding protein n=1 Tax=Nakamurella lactea TaxID=459515 RepID=UPI00040C2265|nr:putative F420-0 ABC transporter substrate-binding protein [Nakamurella lactea]